MLFYGMPRPMRSCRAVVWITNSDRESERLKRWSLAVPWWWPWAIVCTLLTTSLLLLLLRAKPKQSPVADKSVRTVSGPLPVACSAAIEMAIGQTGRHTAVGWPLHSSAKPTSLQTSYYVGHASGAPCWNNKSKFIREQYKLDCYKRQLNEGRITIARIVC